MTERLKQFTNEILDNAEKEKLGIEEVCCLPHVLFFISNYIAKVATRQTKPKKGTQHGN